MGREITKEMHIQEIIQQHPETLEVFRKYRLDCASCQIAEFEEVCHGAKVHHIDPDRLVRELNDTPQECEDFRQFAARHGLLVTAGSDFHGMKIKPKVKFAAIEGNGYGIVERLKEAREKL